MADYGIKVTLPGKDVSSTVPEDYVLNSKYGAVKVNEEPPNKACGTITIGAASSGTVSIQHGLSFVPMVLLYTELKPGSGHWYMGGQNSIDPSDVGANVSIGDYQVNSYVDSSYIKVKYVNATGSSLDVKYYYFIFADNG